MDKMSCNTLSKENQKDYISHLQDEILVTVLSRLSMKEAARTSVLSRRWKNIWKFYTGCFNFDAIKMIMDVLRRKILGFIGGAKYVYWVNRVLNSHQSQIIEELRISFDLDRVFTNDIDRWIDLAIAKRVRRLELDLSPTSDNAYHCYHPHKSSDDKQMYKFPTWLLNFPIGFPDFDALTSLRLKSVDLSEEDVQHFLSNCQMLEHLSIDYSPSLHNLKCVGPSQKLKHLEIMNCLELKNLNVSARNLMFFKYAGPKINMFFGDVPKLSSVSLRGYFCRLVTSSREDKLPFSLSQLEMLALDPPISVRPSRRFCNSEPPPWELYNKHYVSVLLPELINLRELELNFRKNLEPSILCLSSFMYASPHLQKLLLTYESTEDIRFRWDFMRYRDAPDLKNVGKPPAKLKHQYLKEVEFFGWINSELYCGVVEHLIETTSSLERITVDTCYKHDFASVAPPRTDEAKNQVAKQLEPVLLELSPNTKLVIL